MSIHRFKKIVITSEDKKAQYEQPDGSAGNSTLVLYYPYYLNYYVVILLAIIVRIVHFAFFDMRYPLSEAGLYAEFSEQIVHNNFFLPKTIPFYSDNGIPFGYMPLPFYVLAFFTNVLGFSTFTAVNVVPPLFSIISLPVFYFLIKTLKLGRQERLYALVAFSLFPLCFEEFVEPTGLAESMGNLALILFVYCLGRDTLLKLSDALFSGSTFALCVLSSPGSAMASVIVFLVKIVLTLPELVTRKRNYKKVLNLCIIGVFAIFCSSPYWFAVIHNHGIQFFSSVFKAQSGGTASLLTRLALRLLQFEIGISHLNLFPLVFVAFLGLLHLLSQKSYLFVGISFICCLAIPREEWIVSIFVSIAFGVGLYHIFKMFPSDHINMKFSLVFLIILISLNIILELYNVTYIKYLTKKEDPYWADVLQATEWIKSHTETESKVVVITDLTAILEWIPYLTKRTVLNTVFGTEWEPTEQQTISHFNTTISNDGLDHIEKIVYHFFRYREFILIVIKPAYQNRQINPACISLNVDLRKFDDPEHLIYKNDTVKIYSYKSQGS